VDLYILRHAWAEEPGDPRWTEEKRPLTEVGRRRFTEMVDRLVRRDFAPQIIATSPLARCLQTAEIIAQGVVGQPQVVVRGELAPGSNLTGMIQWTIKQGHHHQRIAWVGHSPDVERMTAALVGASEALIRFSKGAAACIRFSDRPGHDPGELRWLVTAKILGVD